MSVTDVPSHGPPAVIKEAGAALGCDLVQSYGMTGSCGPITFLDPDDHRRGGPRPASAGRAPAGVEIRVCDPATGADVPAGTTGEVWTRSALLTPGYLGDEADESGGSDTARAFRAGGWFRTGDAGHLDDGGYLFLTDRVTGRRPSPYRNGRRRRVGGRRRGGVRPVGDVRRLVLRLAVPAAHQLVPERHRPRLTGPPLSDETPRRPLTCGGFACPGTEPQRALDRRVLATAK